MLPRRFSLFSITFCTISCAIPILTKISFLIFCCHWMFKLCLKHFISNACSLSSSFCLNVQVSAASAHLIGFWQVPSVSGSLWAKPGHCGCPAWQSCHWLLSCVTDCEGWAFCLNYNKWRCYVMLYVMTLITQTFSTLHLCLYCSIMCWMLLLLQMLSVFISEYPCCSHYCPMLQ